MIKEVGMVWFYEYWQQLDVDWVLMYFFVEVEILLVDVQIMNLVLLFSCMSIFQK